MTAVMQGVRILEVAEQTFVPAASALLSDWGAEVIKVEHVERGDAMRGLGSTGVVNIGSDVHALLEHSNRGKKSIGLDLTSDEGLEILYRLAACSDVFLTNKLPHVRAKLRIGVAEIRAQNPSIIYVRGTGQGERGPDANKGSYDHLAFWVRSGVPMSLTRQEGGEMVDPPGPGFGDSIGAMTIAGGIMGALFHRERSGDATVVDVSLLGTGMWAMGQVIALSLATGMSFESPTPDMKRNPLVNNYTTKDGRILSLCCLQAGAYWSAVCEVIDRPDLIEDQRFTGMEALLENGPEAIAILKEVFASKSAKEWRLLLEDFKGQWAFAQDTLEVAEDAQSVANGYVQPCETADGVPFRLIAAPIQFDEEPAIPRRAPEFNEHGDAILADLGLDWDTVIDLKIKGIVA
jgi:crotonobetainyl-CoA:carnitine CoA-transferase CaiB-like acyl-CoA transferase